MCAGHFYLATLFLAMKEAFPASLHIEKCLEIRKTIFPAGHSKIEEGEKSIIHSFFITKFFNLYTSEETVAPQPPALRLCLLTITLSILFCF